MKFLRRLRAATKMAFGSGDLTMNQLMEAAGAKKDESPRAIMEQKYKGWVYVCASRNAHTVASIPLRLYTAEEVLPEASRVFRAKGVGSAQRRFIEQKQRRALSHLTELTEHPLLDLLRLANPEEIGFSLIERTDLHQELIGNAYWLLEPYGDSIHKGLPKNIWPLLPHLVTPVVGKDKKSVVGYLYGKGTKDEEAFDVSEIIHFRFPNPMSLLVGMGPAQAGIMAINRKEAMDEYRQALYDNHCRPDFVVSLPAEHTDLDDVDRLYEQWDKRFKVKRAGGSRNYKKFGRPWITTSDRDIKPLSFPPNKMLDIPQAKLDRDEIYQMFGNPLTMGEISKSRAEAETGEYTYMKHTIAPRCIRFEQWLNETLVPMYDPRLFVAFDNPVPEDREKIRQDVKVAVEDNLITRNEGRVALGWDEHPDADTFLHEVAGAGGGGGLPMLSAGKEGSIEPAPFSNDPFSLG